MNIHVQANDLLLFKHEVLKARLAIRDFFLKNTVREVYENIGQVLSLVRVQLALLDTNSNKKELMESVESPGHLVGKSIKDLRVMCKSFYPDADIISDDGFIDVFRDTIKILYHYENPVVKIKGIQKEIQPELKLIVFKMIQELLTLMKESEGTFVSLTIEYKAQKVSLIIIYNGIAIPLDGKTSDDDIDLTLEQRAQLIGGKLNLIKHRKGLMQIQLSHPLNYLYE
jgi:glucose-6-phosphate-specific signal transduction histidine kinase